MEYKHEYADKYVSKLEDIPTTPHWAILETGTHHGEDPYGRDATDYVKYEVYYTEDKWRRQIGYRQSQTGFKRDFRAIKALPAQVRTEVIVHVE